MQNLLRLRDQLLVFWSRPVELAQHDEVEHFVVLVQVVHSVGTAGHEVLAEVLLGQGGLLGSGQECHVTGYRGDVGQNVLDLLYTVQTGVIDEVLFQILDEDSGREDGEDVGVVALEDAMHFLRGALGGQGVQESGHELG